MKITVNQVIEVIMVIEIIKTIDENAEVKVITSKSKKQMMIMNLHKLIEIKVVIDKIEVESNNTVNEEINESISQKRIMMVARIRIATSVRQNTKRKTH